jgi:hypothetical protein
MAYFKELSQYSYLAREGQARAENVGWLEKGHPFDQEMPSGETLDALWELCRVSVVQARGFHICDLCPSPAPLVIASRAGDGVRLGSAEIRVFSPCGRIYAAPNLVYHYVRTHHYKPPQEFLKALNEGPLPTGPDFFDRLAQAGLEWHETFRLPGDTRESEPVITGLRHENVGGKWQSLSIQFPVVVDRD